MRTKMLLHLCNPHHQSLRLLLSLRKPKLTIQMAIQLLMKTRQPMMQQMMMMSQRRKQNQSQCAQWPLSSLVLPCPQSKIA